MTFIEELRQQRRDDHRYYHHSRVNQSLHLLSALGFLTAYALLAFEPVLAVMIGWIVAMWSRQIGHFFFEPRGYDHVNDASHEYKEAIKVGYNLRRKVVLLSLWGVSPLLLLAKPALFGLFEPHRDWQGYAASLSMLWLWIGVGGLAFRTVHLFFIKGLQSGLVWCTKILTDPFHDLKLYHRAPLALLRGELLEPAPQHG